MATNVVVRMEISGISKDELSHVCYCGVGDPGYIYRRTWPRMLLWCWRSRVYLKMTLAISVTVEQKISVISNDELSHA